MNIMKIYLTEKLSYSINSFEGIQIDDHIYVDQKTGKVEYGTKVFIPPLVLVDNADTRTFGCQGFFVYYNLDDAIRHLRAKFELEIDATNTKLKVLKISLEELVLWQIKQMPSDKLNEAIFG